MSFVCLLLFAQQAFAAYGVDASIWQQTTFTDAVVSCLKSSKRAEFVSIGAINRSGVGISVKPNPGVKAMTNRGWNAGMQADVYIFLTKELDYYQQIAGPVDDLKRQGVRYNKIWIDVENDNHWSSNVATNVAGLKECVRACRDKGVDCGIYSAKYFWNVAFAGNSDFKYLPLWYARWDGAANFDKWATTDSFGGWAKPYGKQFTGDVSVCGCQVDENFSQYVGAGAASFVTPELSCTIGSQSGLCRSEAVCDQHASSGNMDSQWTDANARGCEMTMASIKCCVLKPKPVVTAATTVKAATPRPTSPPTTAPPTTSAPPPLETTTSIIATTIETTSTTLPPRILKLDDALVARGAIWFYRSIPPESAIDNVDANQLQDWQTNAELGYKTLDSWSLGATPIGYGDSVQYKTQILTRSASLWLRLTFDLSAKAKLMIPGLRLFVASDNSADVYLNGKLVSDEAKMGIDHEFQYWNIVGARIDPSILVVGKNLISAYVVNPPKTNMLSSDIYFDLELKIAAYASITPSTAMQTFPPLPSTRTVFYTGDAVCATILSQCITAVLVLINVL